MNDVSRQPEFAVSKNIGVREIRGQQRVIATNRRTKQQGFEVVDKNLECGEIPGVLVVKAVWRPRRSNDVSVMVENPEDISMFQRAGAPFESRLGLRNIGSVAGVVGKIIF